MEEKVIQDMLVTITTYNELTGMVTHKLKKGESTPLTLTYQEIVDELTSDYPTAHRGQVEAVLHLQLAQYTTAYQNYQDAYTELSNYPPTVGETIQKNLTVSLQEIGTTIHLLNRYES